MGLVVVCSFVSLCSYIHRCSCDSERCSSLTCVIVCCLCNRGLNGMGTNNYRFGFGKCFCSFCLISIGNFSVSGVACNAWCISSSTVSPTLKCYCRCDVSLTNLYCCTTGYGVIIVHSYLIVDRVASCICIFR